MTRSTTCPGTPEAGIQLRVADHRRHLLCDRRQLRLQWALEGAGRNTSTAAPSRCGLQVAREPQYLPQDTCSATTTDAGLLDNAGFVADPDVPLDEKVVVSMTIVQRRRSYYRDRTAAMLNRTLPMMSCRNWTRNLIACSIEQTNIHGEGRGHRRPQAEDPEPRARRADHLRAGLLGSCVVVHDHGRVQGSPQGILQRPDLKKMHGARFELARVIRS